MSCITPCAVSRRTDRDITHGITSVLASAVGTGHQIHRLQPRKYTPMGAYSLTILAPGWEHTIRFTAREPTYSTEPPPPLACNTHQPYKPAI